MRHVPFFAAALVACAALKPAVQAEHAEPLPFIEDDWPKALELAKQTGKPIFVDTWAPW